MSGVYWRGIIAPLNTPDAIGRKIKMSGDVKARKLPLPYRYQEADWGAHNGARQVGLIDRVWIDGSDLWGEGHFDMDDPFAADVVRKIRNGFVRHMSADIEPGTDKLMGATIVDIPAFEDAEIKSISELAAEVEPERELVSFAFRVVGDTGLSFASRERAWDSGAAAARVAAWAGGDDFDVNKYRRAFLYQDAEADPKAKGSYKLPFADVIDGELKAVPRAVFAVASRLGQTDIPGSDKATIKRRVSAMYSRMGKQFDDPSLHAPWDSGSLAVELSETYAGLVRRFEVSRQVWLQSGVK